jgi:hypothetical protein
MRRLVSETVRHLEKLPDEEAGLVNTTWYLDDKEVDLANIVYQRNYLIRRLA